MLSNRHLALALVAAISLTMGCGESAQPQPLPNPGTNSGENPDQSTPSCVTHAQRDAVQGAERTTARISEMQALHFDLAGSLFSELVLSGDVFPAETEAAILEYDDLLPLQNFEVDTGGRYRWIEDGESELEVTFWDSTTGEPVPADPFLIESYMEGVSVTTEPNVETVDDNELPITWTFTFEALGPLGHLLELESPDTTSFAIEASLSQMTLLVFPGLTSLGDEESAAIAGPFRGLTNLETSARMTLEGDRELPSNGNAYTVDAQASVPRTSLGEVQKRPLLPLDIVTLDITIASLVMELEGASLSAGNGGWPRGELALTDGDVEAVITYEEGESPATTWDCL